MANQRPLKEILEFHAQTIGLSDDKKKKKADEIGLDFDEFTRRIGGKKKEAEFVLYLMSLKVVDKIEEIDESESAEKGEYTPDFYIEFRDGYKMYLEVKHTDESKREISGGNLQKRIDFATEKGIPLRFAFSLKGNWILLTSEQLQHNGGKVKIGDILDSWLDIELGTCSYQFIQPLKIVSKYSRKVGSGLGIFEDPYGELVSHKLYNNQELIFEVSVANYDHLALMALLNALHDTLSEMERWVVSAGDVTIVTDQSNSTTVDFTQAKGKEDINNRFIMIPEYKFFLSILNSTSALIGENVKDNVFAIFGKERQDFQIITADYIRYAMLCINELGVPVYCMRRDKGYAIKDFKEHFWRE